RNRRGKCTTSTVDSGRDWCWTEARSLRHSVGAKNGLWLWCFLPRTFEAVASGGDGTPYLNFHACQEFLFTTSKLSLSKHVMSARAAKGHVRPQSTPVGGLLLTRPCEEHWR
ncbi:unnamed protein product, partial [Ectocarpus sp. 4 AP-2014]